MLCFVGKQLAKQFVKHHHWRHNRSDVSALLSPSSSPSPTSSSSIVEQCSRSYFTYSREITHPIPGRKPNYVSAEEAVSVVKSGDYVFIHGAAATPVGLVPALVEHGKTKSLKHVTISHIHTGGAAGYNDKSCQGIFRSNSLFTAANCRQAIMEGRADYTPIFLGDIPKVYNYHIIPVDVALVQVTPPDKHGFCSLGTSVDVAKAACSNAKYIIGQVNKHFPRTFGAGTIHISHFDALVKADIPMPNNAIPPGSADEKEIGKLIASNLIEDGATLQIGIGSIPEAVLSELANHKDLGVHSEMLGDGIVDLFEKGALTNSKKALFTGFILASFLNGGQRLYDFVDDNPYMYMMPIDFVNDEFNIAKNPAFTAINSCIEIDIFGSAVSDCIGPRIYSGFGGQVDFIRGAGKGLDGKGKPILALCSQTKRGESKIVHRLKPGSSVVTSRAHTQYVVTEHGIAYLFGKSLRQRAHAMIAISHPDHREALEKAAFEQLKCMPSAD